MPLHSSSFHRCVRQSAFGVALEAIIDARELFPNLRGLFIGQSPEPYQDCSLEYRTSTLSVFDIRDILISFPDLEILQIYGYFGEYIFECDRIEHSNLKTLIIEGSSIHSDNIAQISNIDMPNLEYFELWLTGACINYPDKIIDTLEPILSRDRTPHLKYLGLCSCDDTDKLIDRLLKSSELGRLAVLDLKMGIMTDKGIQSLIRTHNLDDIKILNVSGNNLSDRSISELNKQYCQIINIHSGIDPLSRPNLLGSLND